MSDFMDVKYEINQFIEQQENNGALLLTGRWGCGKSYSIKEIAEEKNRGDKHTVVIISLFGICSITDIEKKIKESLINLLCGSEDKASGIKQLLGPAKTILSKFEESSKLLKGISTALSINIFDFISIESEMQIGTKKKKLILVFDDLERSQLNINELLGIINDYCENKNIKTIIIADEDKIGVAEKVAEAENEKSGDNEINNFVKNSVEDKYKEFKEKVVGSTLVFDMDYNKLITQLLSNFKTSCTMYKEFLQKPITQNLAKQVFGESKTDNIRTLKSWLISFERVYKICNDNDVDNNKIQDIFYTFGAILFEVKSNNYKKNKYGYLFADNDCKQKYTNFAKKSSKLDSLQIWLVENEWNEQKVTEEIKQKLSRIKLSDEQVFLNSYLLDLDMSIVNSALPKVLLKAYDGALSCKELRNLIIQLNEMSTYNIALGIEVDCEKIENGLEIRKRKIANGIVIEEDMHFRMEKNTYDSMAPEMQTIYNQLVEVNRYANFCENKKAVIHFFKLPEKESAYDPKIFNLDVFDSDVLYAFLEKFIISSNSYKCSLPSIFEQIKFKNKAETLKSYELLSKQLSSIKEDEKDEITKAIIQNFIDKIPKQIQKYKS